MYELNKGPWGSRWRPGSAGSPALHGKLLGQRGDGKVSPVGALARGSRGAGEGLSAARGAGKRRRFRTFVSRSAALRDAGARVGESVAPRKTPVSATAGFCRCPGVGFSLDARRWEPRRPDPGAWLGSWQSFRLPPAAARRSELTPRVSLLHV